MPLKLTPDFPASLDTALTLLTAVNSKESLLNGALANDANGNNGQPTIIDVVSTAGFPTQGLILIDAEVISYTGITATSVTGITRAQDGTVSAVHISLTAVKNGVIALYHNIMALMGIELERYHIEGNWLLLQASAGVRTSGTVFTITGDWTTRIQAGDKIKLTDTTIKYSYIALTPTFGAGVTTITLFGSILVGNPSLIYYSKSLTPQGYPGKVYGQAYRTSGFTVSNKNVWDNIALANTNNLKNITLGNWASGTGDQTNNKLTVALAGVYKITYTVMVAFGPVCVARLYNGNIGAEIVGSATEMYNPFESIPYATSTTVITSLSAGDFIILQYGASTTGGKLVWYDDANIPNPTNQISAIVTIERIDD